MKCPCPKNGCVALAGKVHGKHVCPNCGLPNMDGTCHCIKDWCPCGAMANVAKKPGQSDCPCVKLGCPCMKGVQKEGDWSQDETGEGASCS